MSLRQHIPSFEFEWHAEEKGSRVTYNGREVENPVLRAIVAFVAIVGGMIVVFLGMLSVVIAPLVFVVTLLLCTIALPFHLLLWAFGRKGFLIYDGGMSVALSVKRSSFQRRDEPN